jgi:hypothetical protein
MPASTFILAFAKKSQRVNDKVPTNPKKDVYKN